MSIDAKYEKNYSPSMWNKRYDNDAVLVNFLQLAAKVTDEAKKTIPCKLNIPYGTSNRTKYDIYGTNLSNDAPVYIFIHGGYWQECSKEHAGFGINYLISQGIKVINIGYDLCPSITLTEIFNQIKNAVENILSLCKKNGSKSVWISGHSAGATLAANLLHDLDWKNCMCQQNLFQLIKGLVLISGIYTLRPLLKTSLNVALKLTEDEIKTFSFNTIDTSQFSHINDMKVILAVGECDSPKFIQETRHYAQRLANFVDRVEYIFLRSNIDHFDIVENLQDSQFLLTRVLINNIKQ